MATLKDYKHTPFFSESFTAVNVWTSSPTKYKYSFESVERNEAPRSRCENFDNATHRDNCLTASSQQASSDSRGQGVYSCQ